MTQVLIFFFRMVNTQSRQCYHQVQVGGEGDGGWQVCVYDKYNFKEPCLVYSFGYVYFSLFIVDMILY